MFGYENDETTLDREDLLKIFHENDCHPELLEEMCGVYNPENATKEQLERYLSIYGHIEVNESGNYIEPKSESVSFCLEDEGM